MPSTTKQVQTSPEAEGPPNPERVNSSEPLPVVSSCELLFVARVFFEPVGSLHFCGGGRVVHLLFISGHPPFISGHPPFISGHPPFISGHPPMLVKQKDTPSKFNSSPLKNDAWKTSLSFWGGWAYFQRAFAVKFSGVYLYSMFVFFSQVRSWDFVR